MEKIRLKVIEEIEKSKKQQIKFLQKLVQTPSQNGIDPERKIAKVVYDKLREFGFRPKLIGDKNRPSVLSYCNQSKGKKLFFNAPLDTVPASDLSKWQYSPFSGKIVGNKLYGRGSADCKAAIAIMIYSASALFKFREKIKGQLILAFDSDEQIGKFTGIKNLLRQGLRAEAAIVGYPGSKEIIIGSRGWLRLKITTFGTAGHTGARYLKTTNAIDKMSFLIRELKNLRMTYRKSKLFSFGPKLTVTTIKGGRFINVIPEQCEISLDIRLIPSQNKLTVFNDFKKFLNNLKKQDPELRIKIEPYGESIYGPPYQISPKEKIVKILKKNAKKILGKEIKLAASGGGSIANILANKGIRAIGGFGVESENIHDYNEYIHLNSVIPVTKIYALTALDFLK